MTPQSIALQMLPMIGISSLDPAANANNLNQSGISQSDIDQCATAITQALQEIFALGPTALSEERFSAMMNAPLPVSFTATQGSTTISGFSPWASWMVGCTVQGGDDEDNELLSATALLRPYKAGSGVVSATVYGDAIQLPDWIKNTIEPVETLRVWRLHSATNREEFRFYNSPYRGDRAHQAGRGYYTTRTKTEGDPVVYFVEPRYDPATGALPLFMRFNPMSGILAPVTFRAKRKPPVVTSSDISATMAVTVAGTLLPDATGSDYSPVGTFNSANLYSNVANTYLLFFTGTAWVLQAIAGSLVQGVDCWAMASTNGSTPAGTYEPAGANTGEATITTSGAAPITIPTDWHESILLPFAKKWFMSHPAFNNPPVAAQIMEQYRLAKLNLESFIPQISPEQAHYY